MNSETPPPGRCFHFFSWRKMSPTFMGLLLLLVGLLIWVLSTADTWPDAVAKVEAAGKKAKVFQVVEVWSWWGLVADTVLVSLLLLTFCWWSRKDIQKDSLPIVKTERPSWHWLLLGILLMFALVLRWPRMELSLYNDEAYNFVRQIAGFWRLEAYDADPVFREASWVETLWLNKAGNNSQIYSALSRGSYDLWCYLTNSPVAEVNETALRLPALLAGLASLAVLAATLRNLLGNSAWVWLLVVGALHPWHLRYSTEARGYSIMLLGITLTWYFLERALKYGRWRYWLGYGSGVLLTVWGFPGAVYFLIVQTGLLITRQIIRCWTRKDDAAQLYRPVIACVLAVMIALPLMLPLIPGLLQTLESGVAVKGRMTITWWQDLAAYLFVGCRWLDGTTNNPANVCLDRLMHDFAWVRPAFYFASITVLLGAYRLFRLGGAARLLALSGPLALCLAFFAMTLKENYLHHWYAIYALPSMLGLMVAGLVTWPQVFRVGTSRAVVVVQVLAAFALLVLPASVALKWRRITKQDNRAPVLAVRGNTWPRIAYSQAIFAATWCVSDIYDPRTLILKNDAELSTIVDLARQQKRELYVAYSHEDLASPSLPQTLGLLKDPTIFEAAARYYGQEEAQYDVFLYKLKQ